MNKNIKERRRIINTELAIPLGELAIYVLKKGEKESALLDLLFNNPGIVNTKVKRIIREVLRDKGSKIKVIDLNFDYNDSDKFSIGASYFEARLKGTEKELRRVAGEDKIFSYDWEDNR